MTKLNLNDVIMIAKPVCGFEDLLITGQKYRVVKTYKDFRGADCYTFKNARKNAVTTVSFYSEDIDSSIDTKTLEQVKSDCRLYQMFMKPIVIVK